MRLKRLSDSVRFWAGGLIPIVLVVGLVFLIINRQDEGAGRTSAPTYTSSTPTFLVFGDGGSYECENDGKDYFFCEGSTAGIAITDTVHLRTAGGLGLSCSKDAVGRLFCVKDDPRWG